MPEIVQSDTPPGDTRTRVVVTSIDVGFGDLVILLFKLGLAAIPAGLLLGLIWLAIIGLFANGLR